MSSSNENIYIALYLYTAVIEFVYFTIIHLQNRGRKYATDIAKHLKFFKPEVTMFVHTFNGKDIAEKCCNMLCTATPIFYPVNENLALSKDYQYFKQIIYEDFLISKSVDLILRGICDIQEICETLNLSYIIKVNRETLTSILKQYPYFYLDKNSVVIVQFHGLLGFHDYTYEKVVQYFLSIVQNTYLLSYSDVRFHNQYVPSCGIRSYLITFCILNASNIFKCRNSHVYISKKSKKLHYPSQTLSIQTLNKEQPLSTNMLVYQSLGSKLRNWTGEIYQLLKNSGIISCVVDLQNNSQKIFFIYFHKTALRCLKEMRNLSEHLNVRDVVQFDATFHSNVEKRGKCWQASRVSVLKSSKQQILQFNIDPKLCTGSTSNFYCHNSLFKYLLQIKCPLNFNINQLKLIKEKAIFNQSQLCETIIEDTFNLLYDKQSKCCEESTEFVLTSHMYSENKCLSSSHSTNESPNMSSSFTTCIKQESSLLSLDDQIFHLEKPGFNCLLKEKNLPTEVLKSCLNNYKNKPGDKHLDRIKDTFIRDNGIVNLVTNQHTFLFGDVETLTSDDGIVICSFNKKSLCVYFQNKTLFVWNSGETTELISKHSKMLVAIPYFHENDIYHVATFVYLLNETEVVYIAQEQLDAKDFIANYFAKKFKLMYRDMKCYCDIDNNFKFDSSLALDSDNTKQIMSKCSNVINSLKEICILDEKNFKCIRNLIIIAQKKNLAIKMPKMYLNISSFLKFIFPVLSKQQFSKRFHKRNIFHSYEIKRNKHQSLSHLAVICRSSKSRNSMNYDYSSNETSSLNIKEPECNIFKKCKSDTDLSLTKQCRHFPQVKQILDSCSSLGSYASNETNSSYISEPECNIFKKSISDTDSVSTKPYKHFLQVKQMHDSCSSLGLYASCESVNSSDNVYYSCESTVNMSDLDLEVNNCSDSQSVNLLNLTPGNENANSLLMQNAQMIQTAESTSGEMNKSINSNFNFKTFNDSKQAAIFNIDNKPKKSIFCKHKYEKKIPSLSSTHILKHRFIKNKKCIIWRPTKICRYCSNESIEVTAYISVISNTCVFLNPKDNYNAFLSFPKKLIPEKLLSNLKLNSSVNVTLIPNIIPNFSQVLQICINHTY